jgi:hypothetical protein
MFSRDFWDVRAKFFQIETSQLRHCPVRAKRGRRTSFNVRATHFRSYKNWVARMKRAMTRVKVDSDCSNNALTLFDREDDAFIVLAAAAAGTIERAVSLDDAGVDERGNAIDLFAAVRREPVNGTEVFFARKASRK